MNYNQTTLSISDSIKTFFLICALLTLFIAVAEVFKPQTTDSHTQEQAPSGKVIHESHYLMDSHS